ncbi:MAG: RNA polymerase sigma factor [Deltaproteobacteria bacterium]|nr:RNA polymerase sigma factor [Deltaproteobacteria bacterium]
MSVEDDAQLMQAVAAGDRRAMEALYAQHVDYVFRIAYRFLLDEDEACDLTQSVFVSLIQSARRYRPEAKLTTWIYRVVVNRCLNQCARAGRRLRSPSSEAELAEMPASEESRPDRIAAREQQRARVRAAILELPERQRMALVLRRFEQKSYAEIADALGCSVSSVESLLFRARRSLANKMLPLDIA